MSTQRSVPMMVQVEDFIRDELRAHRIPTATDINVFVLEGPPSRINSINGRYSRLRIRLFKEYGLVKDSEDPFSGRWQWPTK